MRCYFCENNWLTWSDPDSCYNQAFEKSVLRNLAELFPDLADALLARVENVRDLMVPFRKRDL